MEGDSPDERTLFPASVGDKLRSAREARGMELAEVAQRTRIPQRHLEAIETANFAALPSITYALGFAKAYARTVGADEVAIGRELRAQLDTGYYERHATPLPSYQSDDAVRGAPPATVWIGLVVALVVLIGVGLWYGTDLFRGSAPSSEQLVLPEETPTVANTTAAAPVVPDSGGQVSITASDTAWVRVTDAAGRVLLEKEMAAGERYDVPPGADRPRLRTGRPDRLSVTINGSSVPPLGAGVTTIEVEVSAEALRARGTAPAAAPSPAAAAGAPAAAGGE